MGRCRTPHCLGRGGVVCRPSAAPCDGERRAVRSRGTLLARTWLHPRPIALGATATGLVPEASRAILFSPLLRDQGMPGVRDRRDDTATLDWGRRTSPAPTRRTLEPNNRPPGE